MDFAVSYHVEGPRERPSAELYQEIAGQVELADRLGYEHAWFAEHHGHAHVGHVPHPLGYCLHLTARTSRIRLGAAVVCVNLHHPVAVAEHIAMLDVLSGGRASVGLGSGSTPPEMASYGAAPVEPEVRRARFLEALDVIELALSGEPFEWDGPTYRLSSPGVLPRPMGRAQDKLWIGAASPDSARLAGERGFGLQMSNIPPREHLRTLVEAYREGRSASTRALGPERIAASAPLYVAESDGEALDEMAPALGVLVREGRRAQAGTAPATPREQAEALRFAVGSPETVAKELEGLRDALGYTTLTVRPRWAGMSADMVERSLRLFAERVRPALEAG